MANLLAGKRVAAHPVLRPEQRREFHVRQIMQHVNRRGQIRGHARRVGDEADTLAFDEIFLFRDEDFETRLHLREN